MMNREIYEKDLRASVAGLEDWLKGKRVLITGATGTIGSSSCWRGIALCSITRTEESRRCPSRRR